MFSEYNFKNFNFRLLFYALALNAIGLLVINSAVNGDRSYINRQLIGLFGGLVIMLFLALTDYHKLMRCTGVIYLGWCGDPSRDHRCGAVRRSRNRCETLDHASCYRTFPAVGIC